MELGLGGKVALVTGGSRGIGRATALALAREGCSVVVAARGAGPLEATAEEARALGADALAVPSDVITASGVRELVDRAAAWHGRLDVLVTSASVSVPATATSDDDELQRIEGKLMPTIRCSRAAVRHMGSAAGGAIVCLGGTSARTPFSRFNDDTVLLQGRTSLPQGLGNAAVANFVKHFSDEVAGDGVRVNAVHPGIVRTDRYGDRVRHTAVQLGIGTDEVEALYAARSPSGRLVEPEEVAALIVFLASERASGMTGQSVAVDAGMSRVVTY